MGKTLQLNKDQNLSIEGAEYRVTGGIEFHNRSDGSRWWEYCLLETRTRGIKWLSIDNIYEEYAIYTQCPYGSEFDEMNIFRDGYRQADAGQAVVTSCFGQVDASPGDTVRYTEYEDGTEELIIAVEQWEDETEYSKGCYLDMDEIVLLDSGCSGQAESNRTLGFVNMKNLAVAAVILAVLGVLSYTYIQSNKKTIHKYLEGNINFSYQTSITSDLNEKERADVYSTDLSVDDAAKAIIQAIDGGTEDVQKNGEDDSVAILTKSEYCLVYTSTDQTTMVQISSRAYVYQSTNTPYHATGHTTAAKPLTPIPSILTKAIQTASARAASIPGAHPEAESAPANRRKRRKRQESKPAVCIRTKPNQKGEDYGRIYYNYGLLRFGHGPYALWYICGGFGDSL